MRKTFKLLIPAFIAVVLFASCEDKMDEMVNDGPAIENLEKGAFLPPKDRISTPPNL